jgi:hypothetical protein
VVTAGNFGDAPPGPGDDHAGVEMRQVRARYTDRTITVYQAYPEEIARASVAAGRFVAPFKRDRMTWIKPSFLWMMYRCGWATKPGQERVLSIEIRRDGFEWALANAALGDFDRDLYPDRPTWARRVRTSPVRVQWDPERGLDGQPLPYRSLQVGLGGVAVDRYVDEWTETITDITDLVRKIGGDRGALAGLLPAESVYPLPPDVGATVGA